MTAKDLALAIIAAHGADGGQGFAVEYAGAAVRAMGVEARLTLCNMATEFGAVTAVIAPDATTVAWLRGRHFAPAGAMWDRAVGRGPTSSPGKHSVPNASATARSCGFVPGSSGVTAWRSTAAELKFRDGAPTRTDLLVSKRDGQP